MISPPAELEQSLISHRSVAAVPPLCPSSNPNPPPRALWPFPQYTLDLLRIVPWPTSPLSVSPPDRGWRAAQPVPQLRGSWGRVKGVDKQAEIAPLPQASEDNSE